MIDEIVYVGKHFATLPKYSASLNRRIFLTAQNDLTHVKALAEAQDLYHTGESMLDAFKLTCMLGRNGTDDDWRGGTRDEHVALREGRNIRANWEEWMAWLDDSSLTTDGRAHLALFEAANSAEYAYHFQFAVTATGWFCLVPGITTVGDSIAMVVGYATPIVVREYHPPHPPSKTDVYASAAASQSPRPDSSRLAAVAGDDSPRRQKPDPPPLDLQELIGDAYVHGAMEDELQHIMSVFSCRHEPTEAQAARLEAELRDTTFNGWRMLDLSGNYERVVRSLGSRPLNIV